MEYYAHTSNHGNETVLEHLQKVGELASMYGKSFGHEKVMHQIGLLHDVGKNTLNFQRVLQGEANKQDHAIVGAIIYNEHGKEYCADKWMREHIALTGACHHSYLYQDDSEETLRHMFSEKVNLKSLVSYQGERVSKTTKDNDKAVVLSGKEEYEAIVSLVKENKLLIPLEKNDYFDTSSMSENEKMLYERMMFSCLVDADYSATSSFCEGLSISEFYPKKMDVDVFRKKLRCYQSKIASNGNKDSAINRMRQEVYENCGESGRKMSGFVTLTAPTGTGKTLSLMNFAIEQANAFHKERAIVVLPYLSIIEGNGSVYKEIFGEENVLIDSSQSEIPEEARLYADRWEYPIIVTTSVKFFEMLFSCKTTDLRKLHQVANSVVVFDECQTLPSTILNSTVETLQALTKYFNTTVLFSTATKPTYEYRNHIENRESSNLYSNTEMLLSKMNWKADEIIDNAPQMFRHYSEFKNTDVFYNKETVYNCADLIDFYKDSSSVMYVFNTVKHAEEMYEELLANYEEDSCFLITGHMCALDKLTLIKEIIWRLKNSKPVRLAATQCIEAGVDFDFEDGAREIAPWESIVQTAGRVNRNGLRKGSFLIFDFYKNGPYDYPSASYKTASDISKKILNKNSVGSVDLYDLDLMDSYYKELYTGTVSYSGDKKELYDGYAKNCYKDVDLTYNIVENKNQAIIIVRPFSNYDKEEYNRLIDDIKSNDFTITKSIMKQLSPYTVSLYTSSNFNIEDVGDQLSFRRHDEAKTNWYILRDDSQYTDFGLQIQKNARGVYL